VQRVMQQCKAWIYSLRAVGGARRGHWFPNGSFLFLIHCVFFCYLL